MDDKMENALELKKLEEDFNSRVTDLTVMTAENNGIVLSDENDFLHIKVKRELQVDGNKLAQVASNLIEKNLEMTDEEVAIELLKEISNNGESKTMRKLASRMVKEKWWER